MDETRYRSDIESLKPHFENGDVYQVVISTAVRVMPHQSVHAYFARLARRYGSAEFCYWLSAGSVRFFGSNSVPHVTLRNGRVASRVVAGTAPAVPEGELAEMANAFRDDAKYFGEHVMFVDLERNDIGTLAEMGTVRTERLLEAVVNGPTTYLVSDVVAEFDESHGLGDLVLNTFPRGIVVGAPKIRAEEVIAATEKGARGFYGGAVEIYQGSSRSVTSNTIVTCAQVQDDNSLILQVGGGATNESTADQELIELKLTLQYLL